MPEKNPLMYSHLYSYRSKFKCEFKNATLNIELKV